jgi:S1-C subfamily serine protease
MRILDVTPRAPRSTRWAVAAACTLFAVVSWRFASAGPRPEAIEASLAPAGTAAVPSAAALAELREEELATIELFRRNSAAVVHITNAARVQRFLRDPVDVPLGSGTGFVWDESGHIVTNFHVVYQQGRTDPHYYVRFAGDEKEYEAEVVGTAPHRDLAVLRLEDAGRKHFSPISVGSSASLQVGQQVFAIGNPFGLDQTLTTGIISGLGREIRSLTNHKIAGVIQTDAAINPGNSGGPLLDSSGRLIGVNTAIVSTSGAYAGIGFAVPADTVRRVVPELIEHGRASRPGMGVVLLPEDDVRSRGLTGVGVWRVESGSAAEKAGLRPLVESRSGVAVDEIVAIDGVEVRSQQNLFDVLDQKDVGDTVVLLVRRGSKRTEIPVQLQWIE